MASPGASFNFQPIIPRTGPVTNVSCPAVWTRRNQQIGPAPTTPLRQFFEGAWRRGVVTIRAISSVTRDCKLPPLRQVFKGSGQVAHLPPVSPGRPCITWNIRTAYTRIDDLPAAALFILCRVATAWRFRPGSVVAVRSIGTQSHIALLPTCYD